MREGIRRERYIYNVDRPIDTRKLPEHSKASKMLEMKLSSQNSLRKRLPETKATYSLLMDTKETTKQRGWMLQTTPHSPPQRQQIASVQMVNLVKKELPLDTLTASFHPGEETRA